ncbi:MAG: hypothetical protein J5982_05085 [Bacilli bacterium]|nr:hypothetical protein [Bacilli bacterium]
MSSIKRISIIIILSLLFPAIVNAAGGISVSTRSVNVEPNGSKSFTISASNAAGRVDITNSNPSVATISSSSEFLDNNSVSVTVTGKSVGTAIIKVITTDVATYDLEEVRTTYTITVTVSNPSTTKQTTTTTTTTNRKTTTRKTTTLNSITTSTIMNTTTTSYAETTSAILETTKNIQNNKINGTIKLDEFRVIGYDLKEENGKYILNIDDKVDEIYVLASSKDKSVSINGYGIIDIKNKNRVVIEVSKNEINNKYIIQIQKKKSNTPYIIAMLIVIIVILLSYILIDWKKSKNYR